jgi:hypothetical protein
MIAALVYAALAVAIGSALGLMRGPAAIMANPAFLLLTYGFVVLIIFLVRRFYGFPRIRELARSRQWLTAFGIAISTSVVVALSEFTLLWAMPSTGAWVAGMTLGLVLVGAWIERDASLPGAKIAVLLLYVASSLTAISTLLTIPAWQARRLVGRGELEASFRMLNASTRLFVAVLVVALWLPALLLYR